LIEKEPYLLSAWDCFDDPHPVMITDKTNKCTRIFFIEVFCKIKSHV
jgi:hypothetical protein